jgi:serine/threonine-protein kinase
MSPEMLQSQPFDGRSDLYSLGVMLYEMLTGEQPYTGDSPVSVIVKHLQQPPPNLRLSHPKPPEDFAVLIEAASLRRLEFTLP